MSVQNGQRVRALESNQAWASKQDDNTMEGVQSLENPGSGGNIANAQQKMNDNTLASNQNASDIAQNASDISQNASDISQNQTDISSNDTDIADLQTLSGEAANSTQHAGFSGSTFNDGTTKQVLQEAETAIEARIPSSEKGAVNGVATLDGSGTVPASQLPSFVDDVLEFADLASFPVTGETGKIYVALDTNFQYRWSGATYIDITSKVDSVNGQTGVVSLSQADLDDVTIAGLAARDVIRRNPGDTAYENFNPNQLVNDAATGSNQVLSAVAENSIVRLTNASLVSIDEVPAGYNGQQFVLINRTGNQITISNETGSTAVNRILTGTGLDLDLAADASLILAYDPTTQRWQIVGGSGGGGGAATDLSNLTAPTAIPDGVALLPANAGNVDIGSAAKRINRVNANQHVIINGTTESGTLLRSNMPDGTTASQVKANQVAEDAGIATDSNALNDATSTGHVSMQSGNKTDGTGDSGDAIRRTGTSVGGNRGKIRDIDGSEGRAEHVRVSDDVSGGAKWVAPRVQPESILFGVDSDFESISEAISWAAYQNTVAGSVPDAGGTGGSPNVSAPTATTVSGEVINGQVSGKFSKDAANRQGEGWSVSKAVLPKYQGNPCKIRLNYQVGPNFDYGTFGDVSDPSDVVVYLYDVTNGKLLSPNAVQLDGTGFFEQAVHIPSDCDDVRALLHIATTNILAWDFFADDIKIELNANEFVKAQTDWEPWTPTGSWTTNVTYTGFKRQVGDEMEYTVKIVGSGAPNAAILNIDLPAGEVMDSDKIMDTLSTVRQLGRGTMLDFGLSNYDVDVCYNSATTVQILPSIATAAYSARTNGSNGVPFAFNVNDVVIVRWSSPIVGKTSGNSVAAALGLNALAVFGSAYSTGSATITGVLSNISFTAGSDTVGGWTGSTYIVKTPGYYDIDSNVFVGATFSAGQRVDASIYNVTTATFLASDQETYPNTAAGTIGVTVCPRAGGVWLNYGDEIALQVSSTGATPTLGAGQTSFSITKIGSEKQPYAPRVAYFKEIQASASGPANSPVGGTWTKRLLNTLSGDQSFISSSGPGDFTLDAGVYRISGRSPQSCNGQLAPGAGQARLFDVTNAAESIAGSSILTQANAASANVIQEDTVLDDEIVVTAPTSFRLEHWVLSTGGTFGNIANNGSSNLFAELKFEKIL